MQSPAADMSTYDFFIEAVRTAASVGAQVSWNEAGTASCGGIDGIRYRRVWLICHSNVFAGALWAVDAAFTAAFLQVDDIMYAGTPQAMYGPMTFDPTRGWRIEATCKFHTTNVVDYGMLAYALAIHADNTRIYQYSSSNDYKVWSAWNDAVGVNTVTVINKVIIIIFSPHPTRPVEEVKSVSLFKSLPATLMPSLLPLNHLED